jgi:hypothetical protein
LGHVPVKYLVVKNGRDTESRVFEQPFLNVVRKLRSGAWILSLSLTRYLADAVLHHLGGFGWRKVAAIGGKVCLRIYLRAVGPKTG